MSDIANRLHAIVTQAVEEITRLRERVEELDARANEYARIAALGADLSLSDEPLEFEIEACTDTVRIASLEADARRYQYLRSNHWTMPGALIVTSSESVRLGCMTYSADLLDAEIDAAMDRKS